MGFLGPNGSGKTTTIRMLCGLLRPDAGQGTCLGYDILHAERTQIKRHVGYMTQRFSFYEDLSIRENLDFVARALRLADRHARRRRRDRSVSGSTKRQEQLAGHAVRRLEAAPGARRLHHAPAASAVCSTSRRPASIRKRGANSGRRSTCSPGQG